MAILGTERYTKRKWSFIQCLYSLSNVTGCHHLLAVHHDTLWLIVNHFAITFTFPCAFVLFECIISAQNDISSKIFGLHAVPSIFGPHRCYQYLQKHEKTNYFFHGKTQIPQHFSMPLSAFSASIMSARILSIFSSIRSNCSVFA